MAHETGISATSLVCADCGYNLTGIVIGGNCPECGTPVEETVRRLQEHRRVCGTAVASMVCGILSLLVCALLGPVAILCYFGAIAEIKRGGCTTGSRVMATVGLVTGLLSLIVSLGMLVLMAVEWRSN